MGWRDRLCRQRVHIVSKVLVLVSVLGLKYVICTPTALDCKHAASANNINEALLVCSDEYLATQDPATGARLANILRRSGNRAAARALANNLLATSARSDALQVLGKISVAENHYEEGQNLLEKARELHIAERRPREIAVDDQALAGVHRNQKHFTEALRALDSCITKSREADDRVIEGFCHMSAGLVLAECGYYEGAHEELALADPLLVLDRDRADLAIERGTLELRNGLGPRRLSNAALAVLEFERAIQHAAAASLTTVQRKAELNLVFALAELGDREPRRLEEATAHLEIARQLDLDGIDVDERAMLQARIAFHRKDYGLATSINTNIFDKLTEADLRLRIAVMQAEIGLATGILEDAIHWAQQGIGIAEAMRDDLSAIELRPWILSARREPYELLFIALTRAQRLEDALVAFDHWQGRTLLDELARGAALPPATLSAAATRTDALSRLVPMLSRAPVMKRSDRGQLLAAVRKIDLVALFVAGDDVWRISAHHGELDIVDLGPLAALLPALNEFRSYPTRVELGQQLGEKLLGRKPFRKTDETLFVLLDGNIGGEIAGLPVAALRVDGQPLIALRGIVRPARLSELACVPALRPKRSLVIADARGDLAHARDNARHLAAKYGFTAAIGDAATSDALFASAPADLVHIAVHASVQPSGGALELYDRSVSALEISARLGGPAMVFLTACSSATASDSELATSLATGFLASGSSQVIATLRPVRDVGAAEIAARFFAEPAVVDPARGLARIQAALAQTQNTDWPNFVLYGHDTCREGSQ